MTDITDAFGRHDVDIPNYWGAKPVKPSIDELKPQIKKIIKESGSIDYALDVINKLIGGYGVESIRGEWVDHYYQDINLLYVNKGDTYEPTVIYDTMKKKWYIGVSWGDIVEKESKRFDI